jgi:hypothetical protein
VALGFSACGIIGILDNYAVIGVLSVGFLIILINMFIVLQNKEMQGGDKSDQTENLDK